MSEDIIRYDILVQNALRGVIRKALSEVQKTGLPGNHHFFITFMTTAPGVKVSSRIREQYPEQMTIVLQHQYWDLEVDENGFSVGLSFSDVPEKLNIPYSAVRGFYDPSVNFELEFDVEVSAEEGLPGDAEIVSLTPEPEEGVESIKKAPAKNTPAKKAPAGLPAPDKKKQKADAEAEKADASTDDTPDDDGDGADVVSLDAFRKKK